MSDYKYINSRLYNLSIKDLLDTRKNINKLLNKNRKLLNMEQEDDEECSKLIVKFNFNEPNNVKVYSEHSYDSLSILTVSNARKELHKALEVCIEKILSKMFNDRL